MVYGGEIIAKMLAKEGIDTVFGIIDGTYFGFYSTLHEYGIRLITPRHESIGAHMAGAYYRLTGKIGVCMASNGPGVANILPGITVENAEGNRVLLVTSWRRPQISHPDRGGAYQYFEQMETIKNVAKWSATVNQVERIPEIMRKALRELWKGRPGVVHVDVPENFMNAQIENEPPIWEPYQYRRIHRIYPPPELVEEAADLLIESEYPFIHAGTGIVHARAFEELREVAELLSVPVTTSWGARGALREDSRYSVPLPYVDVLLNVRTESELVLILGSRIGETDFWGKSPYWGDPFEQKVIHVDVDDSTLGMNKPATLNILADIKTFLQLLIKEIKKRGDKIPKEKREKRIDQLVEMKEKGRELYNEKLKIEKVPMITAHVPVVAREILGDEAICISDGGDTAMWAQIYQELKVPNTLISTFKFGMLGAGVGQTLGACVANPEKKVFCMIGDGAMGFHMQEIETAVRNGLKPVFLVVSDKQWGMAKLTQEMTIDQNTTMIEKKLPKDKLINTDFAEIKWDELAESMGAFGARARTPEELREALKKAIASEKCAVIHVEVDPVEHKWPPGLMAFRLMHQEPQG